MNSTFYMVEMDYPERSGPGREAFDGFYERHISMLLAIPGFLTAQRFECVHAARAPFLAVYRLAGPEVMGSAAYRSKAGRMSVPERFRARMTNWDRNLLQGPIEHLEVLDGTLNFADRSAADELPAGFAPLKVVGLDRTTAWRGVRRNGPETDGARTFRPITPPLAR